MIAAWCFQCGLDYASDVAECLECGVPTVDHPPMNFDAAGADDEAHLAYELHGWNGAARAAVETSLHQSNLAHAWQGPTLIVREVDEDAVDAIIEEVDERMSTSATAGVESQDGRLSFDLGARNQQLHAAVLAKLTEEGVEHEMLGNGFLLVPTAREDDVGDWIEAIQDEMRASDSLGPGVAGVDSHSVVEGLFLAADVLRRNTRDLRAQRRLLDNAALAADLKLPFGYEAPMWRAVLDQVAVLVALIEDTGDDTLVETEARNLRNMLQTYV